MVERTPPLSISPPSAKKKPANDEPASSTRSHRGSSKKKKAPEAVPLTPLAEERGGAGEVPLLTLAKSPLMKVTAAKPCQLRAECELTSDKAGEVASGVTVHVVEQRQTADGATRMAVVPEGQHAIIGWLTGVTKDGKKNLDDLGRPVCVVSAAKALAAREAFELTSGKAGELPVGGSFHVCEVRETADGAQRIAYAPEGSDDVKGWVTAITKDGTVNVALKSGGSSGAGAAADPTPTGSGGSPLKAPAAAAKLASAAAADLPPAAAKLMIASRQIGSVVSAKVRGRVRARGVHACVCRARPRARVYAWVCVGMRGYAWVCLCVGACVCVRC